MRKTCIAFMLILVTLSAVAAEPYWEKKDKPTGRLLTGRVVDNQDAPLSGSVVYLTDTRTRAVKTYIVGKDGDYRFPQLSPNLDYEVYAQFNGKKSDTKSVSQFDNRSAVNINLKIDTK
jgi:Carboxypeptidase regulatory-like domain